MSEKKFKEGIPEAWLLMAYNQVSNRIKVGSMFGLELPSKDLCSADVLFGVNKGESPHWNEQTDSKTVNEMMVTLAGEVSIAMHKQRIGKIEMASEEKFLDGFKEALDDYGYRALMEEVSPDLV